MIKLKNIVKNLKNIIIQDIPNEFYACGVCKKTECNNVRWLSCENRVMHMRFIDDLDTHREKNSGNK